MNDTLLNLIEITHFTEHVSAKLHGVSREDEVYRVVRESAHPEYTVSILLLDGPTLKIAAAALHPERLKAAEKVAGFHLHEYAITLEESTIFRQVVDKGETIHVPVEDIIKELVADHTASALVEILGYQGKYAVLTPLRQGKAIIGVVAVSSTQLAEYFMPSVENLAHHISAALRISRECAGRTGGGELPEQPEQPQRFMLEHVDDILFQLSPSCIITYVSPNIKDYGYEPDQLIGTHIKMITPGHEVPRVLKAVQSVLSGKSVKNFEITQMTSKGKAIPMEINFTPVRKDGTVVAVQGIMRDITERTLVEREVDEILHDLRERVKELSCLYRIDELVRKAGAVEKMLEEVVYTLHSSWQYPDITGSCITVEDLQYKTDNFEVTPWMQSAPITVHGKKVGQIQVCYTEETPPADEGPFLKEERILLDSISKRLGDFIERKKAEEALKKSEKRYRTVVEDQTELICRFLPDATLTFVNEAYCRYFGKDRKDLIGMRFLLLIPAEDRKKDEKSFTSLTRENPVGTVEHRVIAPGGEIRWQQWTNRAIFDSRGNLVEFQAVGRDITERKQAEEALQWELDVNTALSELYNPLISPASSLEEITQIVLDQAKRLTHSEHGYVGSIDPGTRALVAHTLTEMLKDQCEVSPEKRGIIFLPEEDGTYSGLWGYSLNTLEPFYTNTPGTHLAFKGVPEGHIPVQTFLTVPVLLGREIVGQIALANKKGGYTHQDLDAICRFADVYALAIQRVQIEERLQESEEKFRGIAERNFDAIFDLDKRGYFTYVSPAIERITGYTPEEMVGKSIADYVKEPEVERSYQAHMNVVKGEAVEGFQVEIIRKDGSSAFVELNASPIIKEGTVTGTQGVVRDITERRRAEKELRESEEKYRTLVEQSLQGILIIQDNPPRLVFANPAIAEISGYTAEELLSLSPEGLQSIVHPEDQIVFERYITRLEGKPVEPHYEFRTIRKDGTVRWLELQASRIEYQGEPAVQAAFVDITERRHAEDQIKASLREKEVLLREIHHRVKNNLQVISSLLSLQASHSKDSQYAEMLQDSQHRILTMALIHERLYQSENLANIDVKDYIASIVHGLVRSYNVTERVATTIDVEDVSLGTDAAIPCGLIINELVSNSLKYGFPDRTGEITVSLHAVDSTVELTVADNGIGIPDTIDFRATESLGLNLVVALAKEQLGGCITLDKTEGTAFTITFEIK